MKILELTVKNVAPIMVAMKKRELTIDFTKGNNVLTLLIGGNGTGKTTIGSLLHPFAYNGNMDSREHDLILPDQDGYKSLSILHQDTIYVVQHYYKRNKEGAIGLKSFFSRNGEELNSNGNVSSFKQLVQLHLGIDESYLKLTRLGANVVNIISMNSMERKEFMNKRLEELNQYGLLYKKTSEDLRLIKSLLKINIDKLAKLGIEEEQLYLEQISEKRKTIGDLEKERAHLQRKISKDQGKMEIYAPLGAKAFLEEIDALEKEIQHLMKEFERLSHKVEIREEEGEAILEEYTKRLEDYHRTMEKYSHLLSKRDSLIVIMESSKSVQYLNALKEKKETIRQQIKDHETRFGKETMDMASSIQLREALVVAQGIAFQFHHLYDYPVSIVREIITEANGHWKNYRYDLRALLAKAYNRNDKAKLRHMIQTESKELYIIVDPICGFPQCSYRQFYSDMMEYNQREEEEELDIEGIQTRLEIIGSLIDFEAMVEKAHSILRRIPEPYGKSAYFLERLLSGNPMVDEKAITDFIILMEQQEGYLSNKDALREVEKELMQYSKEENYPKYQMELESVKSQIQKMEKEVKEKKETLEEITRRKEQYKKEEEDRKRFSSIKDSLHEKKVSYEQKLETKSLIEEWLLVSEEREEKIAQLDSYISSLTMDLSMRESKYQQYQELCKEQEELRRDYEDWSIFVESVSPRMGIPIAFMNYYLEGIKLATNDCLRFVYGDSLYIDEMVVDEKTFRITYVKDGFNAGDIRGSSQGESSFINLAISFAFLSQDVREYNIVLLDEIDGVLDMEKKHRFLDILYSRLQDMHCEQCFLITHSDIYNDQYVNLLLTDDSDTSRFHHPTILFQA